MIYIDQTPVLFSRTEIKYKDKTYKYTQGLSLLLQAATVEVDNNNQSMFTNEDASNYINIPEHAGFNLSSYKRQILAKSPYLAKVYFAVKKTGKEKVWPGIKETIDERYLEKLAKHQQEEHEKDIAFLEQTRSKSKERTGIKFLPSDTTDLQRELVN